MRPGSIRKFDIFYLTAIVVTVISMLMNWDSQLRAAAAQLAQDGLQDYASVSLAVGYAITLGVSLLLWALVSRARMGWARWAILLLLLYQGLAIPYLVATGMGTISFTQLISVLLKAVALFFAFRADARAWFAEKPR
ncbi:hypothetical protein [Aurantiacibacter aquimixticola]|uniref:Uncharacterized protein n=1 Tax=Aurantiacibacter aquimixticola TaxID=1958945 RepID=A0A419RUR1_9SPHN|nr:hypothetical protein [Aurantiacibacter aquimixticola]RJY09521.1 hypothetical protein D6201_09270 [Aurantiacibacter aquimixticola]